MDIKEIKKKKVTLGLNISNLINKFEKETDCSIEKIEQEEIFNFSNEPSKKEIILKIKI